MPDTIPLSQLESGRAAKWSKIGDAYAGRIISMEQRQQTDPRDNTPKFFASGDPMMVWVITIEQPDGETAALYASGGKFKAAEGTGDSMLNAIGAAVRAVGASGVDVGAELAVAHTGLSEAKPGMNPARLYTAQYRPPAPVSVPVDLFTS